MKLGRVGIIGRFKPLHIGAARMLEYACMQSEYLLIGIGSSNKYNLRNPFTPEETRDMIDVTLQPRFRNYETIFVPDYGHIPNYEDGQKWRRHVNSHFTALNYFITGNCHTADLLSLDYNIIHPSEIIPPEQWIKLRSTKVRIEMAKGDEWRTLVPEAVAAYIDQHVLLERFRQDFGLETLTNLVETTYLHDESKKAEQEHVRER